MFDLFNLSKLQWWKKFICNLTLTSGGKGGYIVDLSRLNPILLFYIWHVISSFRWLGYIGVSLKVLNQKKFESLTGKHDKKNYAAHCTLHVCRRWCCSCNLSTFVEPPVYWASVNLIFSTFVKRGTRIDQMNGHAPRGERILESFYSSVNTGDLARITFLFKERK